MTVAAATAAPAALAPPDPIAVYRDDGPLSRALGTLLGRALRLPGAGLLLLALLTLVAAIAIGGGDTPHGVAAVTLEFPAGALEAVEEARSGPEPERAGP